MSIRILALDTATEACSVAVLDGNRVYASFEICARDHSRRILPLVQQILAEAGLTLHQLDALVFGCGPGSFTGVRIGTGIVQGLALGADLPVVGISTLQAMAQSAWRLQQSERVLAAIDARMGELYWAVYQRTEQGDWQGTGSEAVLKPETVAAHMATLSGSWTPVGTGWQAWPQLAETRTLNLKEQRVMLPCAEDMLPLAVAELARGAAVAAERVQPVYLRNEVTWKKLPGRG